MQTPALIAKHFREVYFGGNWTASNVKDQLTGITWQQATTQVYDLNTIATLVYHIHYYITGILQVMDGGPLDIKDKYSFDHPPIESQEDWDRLMTKNNSEAQRFATLIEQLPSERLLDIFVDTKYGNYYRNLHGIIEHTHYHLGQIVLIKKILAKN
ncbi:MAG: putative damage-inducible protein DinB [Dokdonia sp.]|jgi:uncharacterized damage-inducible protein DinB